jgi:hypothetical protein
MISAEIFSILGKKVMQTQLAGNLRHEFDLSGVPEGVYLLRLINGTKTGFGIVIKQ